ncbi:cyclophilin-like fold protein [Rhodovulum sp. DZ06]|uniref:cyclophilin-like fold protein n=1 Tax=Rhodovulum sp. DZ06 TaxID=3425126 RepID=UPI003D32F6FC
MPRIYPLPPFDRHRRFGPALLGIGALAALIACSCPRDAHAAEGARLRLVIDGAAHGATLADTAAAQDFAAMLPVSVEMEDYAGKEKIAQPPRAIRTEGSAGGHRPAAGDMTLFAPWGNLAFFYGAAPAHSGLHLLGRMDGGALAAISRPGVMTVRIEAVE